MILTNLNCVDLTIASTIITSYINNPTDYSKMDIEITQNCCVNTQYKETFTLVGATLPVSTRFNFVGNTINYHIDEDSQDKVYTVKIKFTSIIGDSYEEDSNCFFFDCKTKCKVANTIAGFLDVTPEVRQETFITHMVYFGLINASNCGCNCNELCNLYKFLLTLLESNTSDCGCTS